MLLRRRAGLSSRDRPVRVRINSWLSYAGPGNTSVQRPAVSVHCAVNVMKKQCANGIQERGQMR